MSPPFLTLSSPRPRQPSSPPPSARIPPLLHSIDSALLAPSALVPSRQLSLGPQGETRRGPAGRRVPTSRGRDEDGLGSVVGFAAHLLQARQQATDAALCRRRVPPAGGVSEERGVGKGRGLCIEGRRRRAILSTLLDARDFI